MRDLSYVQRRYRAILAYTGLILTICAVVMLTPLLALLAWPEEAGLAWGFVTPAALMAGLGVTAWRHLRPVDETVLTLQEGGVIVLLSWTAVCLISTGPFIALQKLDFTQAVFESVSGWTTTGLSVVDVSAASHLILFWRSIMQLAGGAGLAIIMLSAITGPTGPALSAAEGREQLVPHVRRSAKLVMTIYSGYVFIGTLALRAAGMNWFDAVNHAFAAVSTGGFSTRPESIGAWNSVLIEAVTIPLMVLGNLSFVTAWLLLRAQFRAAGRHGEIRLQAILIPICSATLFLITCRGLYPTLAKGLRVAIFETVTALTTTGFSTVGYGDWNAFGWIILIVLMLIGGGTCSTAGGIKQYRVYLLWKSVVWDIQRALLPRTAVVEKAVQEGDREVFVSEGYLRRVGSYVFIYLFALVVGAAVLASYGYGLKESLFEYASALGTVGLSVGVTSPTAPPGVLWALVIAMLLGRLEFFVIITSALKLARDTRDTYCIARRRARNS